MVLEMIITGIEKQTEAWLVDTCVRNNKGENKENKFTSFLLIQQVTKAGEFVGFKQIKAYDRCIARNET